VRAHNEVAERWEPSRTSTTVRTVLPQEHPWYGSRDIARAVRAGGRRRRTSSSVGWEDAVALPTTLPGQCRTTVYPTCSLARP